MNDYISNRLQPQIDWYSKRATYNQNWYKALKIMEIILTATIPLINIFLSWHCARIANIGISAMLMIIEGVHHIWNYHDLWIKYRQTCELLKRELHLAQNSAGPYKCLTAEEQSSLLVVHSECIISKENTLWAEMFADTDCNKHYSSTNS